MTSTPELTYGYCPIMKSEKTPDGLMIWGKAAGPGLDLDGQRFNAAYLQKAVPAWFEWGNIREQHSAIAAGVGRELEQKGDEYFIKALIVDPVTIKKVELGVLKGLSPGVKRGQVRKSATAPNGEIFGGEMVEISLVDRPSDPTNRIAICKSAGGTTMYPVDSEGELVEMDLIEKVLSGDLHKMLATMDPAEARDEAAEAIEELCDTLIDEAETLKAAMADGDRADVQTLLKSAQALARFVSDGDSSVVEESIQKALSGDSDNAIGTLVRAEITKAVAEVKAPLEARIESLQADLTKAMETPRSGGPVLRTQPVMPTVIKTTEADRYASIAARPDVSRDVRDAFLAAAAETEVKATA